MKKEYKVEIKPRAIKDMKSFPPFDRDRILHAIEGLGDGLAGDVKRLTNFRPDYRLRVGGYRILFNIEEEAVVVYRIKQRKDAYR